MEAVKLLRLILQIGQGELAELAGVSRRELSRIEKAEVMPSRDVAKAIDQAFLGVIYRRASASREGNA